MWSPSRGAGPRAQSRCCSGGLGWAELLLELGLAVGLKPVARPRVWDVPRCWDKVCQESSGEMVRWYVLDSDLIL